MLVLFGVGGVSDDGGGARHYQVFSATSIHFTTYPSYFLSFLIIPAISSHFQPCPALSSHFQPFPAIPDNSCHVHAIFRNFSHFQLFPDSSCHSSHFQPFQPIPAIFGHSQQCQAILSYTKPSQQFFRLFPFISIHFKTFSDIFSNFQPFPGIISCNHLIIPSFHNFMYCPPSRASLD